jgi:hypothetical protein
MNAPAPINKWEAVRRFPFAARPNDASLFEQDVAERMHEVVLRKEGHRPQAIVTVSGKLDEAMRAKFMALYKSGMGGSAIARAMNVSPSRVTFLAKSMGLKPVTFNSKPAGRKKNDPRLLGVPNEVWIDLAAQGLTIMEAAIAAGASHASARRAEDRLGIRFARKREV